MGPPERHIILARLDWERKHVPLGGEVLEPAGRVVRMHTPEGSHHVIIWSELDAETADAVIDREIAYHQNLGVSFEWKVYSHDQPPDLKDRLASRDFEIGEIENVMVMDVDEAQRQTAATGPGEGGGTGIRIETVRSPRQVEIFQRMAEEVFGGDWSFTAGQLRTAVAKNDPGHRGYIGYLDDEPASIGRLYVHSDSHFAGLYGGGTLPPFRRRGIYGATIRARMNDAIASGAKYLMVDARESSRPILERMGFVSIGQTWPCEARQE